MKTIVKHVAANGSMKLPPEFLKQLDIKHSDELEIITDEKFIKIKGKTNKNIALQIGFRALI